MDFISLLADIENKTTIPFSIEYKNGKVLYQGKLEDSKDELISTSLSLNNEILNLLLKRNYEICIPLLKYTIESKLNEIKSKKEELLISLLSSKEVLEDDLRINFPFLLSKTVIFLVHLEGSRYDALNIIRELYMGTDAYAFIYGDDILLIKSSEDNREHAESIKESIASELYSDSSVSFGNEADSYKKVRKCYEEAKMAQVLGETYGVKNKIYSYNNLMMEKIAYSLSSESKNEILSLAKSKLDKFDSEIINTIEEFLRADLNISEASKNLYIHRNTLIYRLDKINKETGFDIRKFKEASVFAVAYLLWKAGI